MGETEDAVVSAVNKDILGAADVKKGKITKEETNGIAEKTGIMPKYLGSGNDAKNSISVIVIVGLLCIGNFLSFFVCLNSWIFSESNYMTDDLKTIWGIVTPILTLTLGYVFGKGR